MKLFLPFVELVESKSDVLVTQNEVIASYIPFFASMLEFFSHLTGLTTKSMTLCMFIFIIIRIWLSVSYLTSSSSQAIYNNRSGLMIREQFIINRDVSSYGNHNEEIQKVLISFHLRFHLLTTFVIPTVTCFQCELHGGVFSWVTF